MIIANMISNTVLAALFILGVFLFVRVFVNFLMLEGSPIEQFLYVFTEPVVSPVRNKLAKSEFFSSIPADFSVQFTLIVLMFVYMILAIFQI
ncbi:MAG: hypothetical protein A2Y17_07870 [Clostridiales bacterium GWF2_38_85]|nr:MAG: hypothetical protein A2Y17_07870 [Clostridiales bacterium GWF2_38_85]HBL84207.1 hypothetical protein [Clostridiales bacterium]